MPTVIGGPRPWLYEGMTQLGQGLAGGMRARTQRQWQLADEERERRQQLEDQDVGFARQNVLAGMSAGIRASNDQREAARLPPLLDTRPPGAMPLGPKSGEYDPALDRLAMPPPRDIYTDIADANLALRRSDAAERGEVRALRAPPVPFPPMGSETYRGVMDMGLNESGLVRQQALPVGRAAQEAARIPIAAGIAGSFDPLYAPDRGDLVPFVRMQEPPAPPPPPKPEDWRAAIARERLPSQIDLDKARAEEARRRAAARDKGLALKWKQFGLQEQESDIKYGVQLAEVFRKRRSDLQRTMFMPGAEDWNAMRASPEWKAIENDAAGEGAVTGERYNLADPGEAAKWATEYRKKYGTAPALPGSGGASMSLEVPGDGAGNVTGALSKQYALLSTQTTPEAAMQAYQIRKRRAEAIAIEQSVTEAEMLADPELAASIWEQAHAVLMHEAGGR